MVWGKAGPRYHQGTWPPRANFDVGLNIAGASFPMLVLGNTSSVRHLEREWFWGQTNMASAPDWAILISWSMSQLVSPLKIPPENGPDRFCLIDIGISQTSLVTEAFFLHDPFIARLPFPRQGEEGKGKPRSDSSTNRPVSWQSFCVGGGLLFFVFQLQN